MHRHNSCRHIIQTQPILVLVDTKLCTYHRYLQDYERYNLHCILRSVYITEYATQIIPFVVSLLCLLCNISLLCALTDLPGPGGSTIRRSLYCCLVWSLVSVWCWLRACAIHTPLSTPRWVCSVYLCILVSGDALYGYYVTILLIVILKIFTNYSANIGYSIT